MPRRASSIDNTEPTAPPPTISTGTSLILGILSPFFYTRAHKEN
jgi:hypothetical protein